MDSDAAVCENRLSRRMKLLLAEDDEINRQIVRSLLELRGNVDLTIVEDGRAALETALSQRFDLMIFDRQMPYLNGDRVIRHLRAANTVNTGTPMILFTASADQASVTAGVNGLADMVLPKPVQAVAFYAALDRLVILA